jgi:hypothetical protein
MPCGFARWKAASRMLCGGICQNVGNRRNSPVSGTELIPRATVEEIVAHRNKALDGMTIRDLQAERQRAAAKMDLAGIFDPINPPRQFLDAFVRSAEIDEVLRTRHHRACQCGCQRWSFSFTK